MFPLADTAKEKGPATVTKLLIAANAAVFSWELWLLLFGGQDRLENFMQAHALVAGRIVRHPLSGDEWLTVLTHMFLHGGLLHLAGNVWFLWIFGSKVEGKLGSFRYLLLYALAGLGAAATQVATGPLAMVKMLGASGAISGVLGAYLVLFPTAFVWTLIPWLTTAWGPCWALDWRTKASPGGRMGAGSRRARRWSGGRSARVWYGRNRLPKHPSAAAAGRATHG